MQNEPSEQAKNSAAPKGRLRRLRARALWVLGLLLAEYLWMSLRFDARQLLRGLGLRTVVFSEYLGVLTPLFVLVGSAALVLAGRSRRRAATRLVAKHADSLISWPFVAINLSAYAGLIWLTTSIAERGASAVVMTPATSLSIAWVSLLVLTVLSLLPAAVPLRAIVPLLRQLSSVLLLAAGLGGVAWLAGIASMALWTSLRGITLGSVYLMLRVLSRSVVYQPERSIVGTDEFYVSVDGICSGLEGIGIIVVFTIVYLISARSRLRFPQALWLIPLGVIAVWIGNTVRIVALIGVGTFISPRIALSGFHSKAGWLFFCAVALSMVALTRRSSTFSHTPLGHATNGEPTWNPSATYLTPLLALIGTSLVTGLFSMGFDQFYALRVLAVGIAVYANRAHLPRPSWPASWHAPAIGLGVFVLWLLFAPHPEAADVEDFRASLAAMPTASRAGWLCARVLGAVVTVPIAEELAFRGFLLRRLIASDFVEVDKRRLTLLSVIISSIAFGSLHGGAWLAGTAAGVAYAFAQRARGRTADAIVAHAITNALIAIAALAFGADWLWT